MKLITSVEAEVETEADLTEEKHSEEVVITEERYIEATAMEEDSIIQESQTLIVSPIAEKRTHLMKLDSQVNAPYVRASFIGPDHVRMLMSIRKHKAFQYISISETKIQDLQHKRKTTRILLYLPAAATFKL